MKPLLNVKPINDANRLGLDYQAEAASLATCAGIFDVHTHLQDVQAARLYFKVADLFGIEKVWSMSNLEEVDAIKDEFGQRVEFIAVPNYDNRDKPGTFTTDWLKRIEGFAAKGVKMCKFWAAPRGRDFHVDLQLDSPIRREGMKLAHSLGMSFMTHVADPDTWFATTYVDSKKYGTKAQQYEPLERLLDEYGDVKWVAAHMGGNPEDMDHLQKLLDAHPNLYLDTSAVKWMVRELSKQPDRFRAFTEANLGRVLFGSDIVANAKTMTFDLFASRYWSLRTMFETDYEGPSPIVDPDLVMIGETEDEKATAMLRGAMLSEPVLASIYSEAAKHVMPF
jgi:predicted TIM-barrel fold metal-dependent hydrolase